MFVSYLKPRFSEWEGESMSVYTVTTMKGIILSYFSRNLKRPLKKAIIKVFLNKGLDFKVFQNRAPKRILSAISEKWVEKSAYCGIPLLALFVNFSRLTGPMKANGHLVSLMEQT
jgi:hypothetical protein